MPVYSQGSPLLLTFDAVLHLYFVFLILSHLYLPTDTAYAVHETDMGCRHSHCSYDSCSGVGLGGVGTAGVLPLRPAKEAISFPFLQKE